jgi:hypothetical protein
VEIYQAFEFEEIENRPLDIPAFKENNFSPEDVEKARSAYDGIIKIITQHRVISDKFSSHVERMKLQIEFREKGAQYEEIMNSIRMRNKLRGNWDWKIFLSCEVLKRLYHGSNEGKQKLAEKFEQLKKVRNELNYPEHTTTGELTFEARKRRVENIEDAVVEFLKVILE